MPKPIAADSSNSGFDIGGIVTGLLNALGSEWAIRIADKQLTRLDGTPFGNFPEWTGIKLENPRQHLERVLTRSIELLLSEYSDYSFGNIKEYLTSPYVKKWFFEYLLEAKLPDDEVQKEVEAYKKVHSEVWVANLPTRLIYNQFLQIFSAQLSSELTPGEMALRIQLATIQKTLRSLETTLMNGMDELRRKDRFRPPVQRKCCQSHQPGLLLS